MFAGDSAIYVLILKSGKADFELNKNEFDSLSGSYMSYLSNEGLNNGTNKFLEISRKLYRLIFKNKNFLPEGLLFLRTDNILFRSPGDSNTGQPVKYFLGDYATSYTYSAKYLMSPFIDRNDSGTPVFFGAPVTYPPYMQLAGLAGSDLSLARVRKNFRNASDLVYSEATAVRLCESHSKYRIIQLYTHAIASGGNTEPIIFFRR